MEISQSKSCAYLFDMVGNPPVWINDWTWAEASDLPKLLGNPIDLTIYFQLVHSNKLDFFMPPLVTKANQPIVTNIFYDQPLTCENHVHYVDMERKISLLHQNLRRSNGCKVHKLGHLVNCFLKLDDRMDEGVR
jgi:hypothetical protein